MSSKFEPDFWTRILAEKGLESPGYHEAAAQAREYTAAKKQQKNEVKEAKTKSKSKRKK